MNRQWSLRAAGMCWLRPSAGTLCCCSVFLSFFRLPVIESGVTPSVYSLLQNHWHLAFCYNWRLENSHVFGGKGKEQKERSLGLTLIMYHCPFLTLISELYILVHAVFTLEQARTKEGLTFLISWEFRQNSDTLLSESFGGVHLCKIQTFHCCLLCSCVLPLFLLRLLSLI